jgi:hypothetical protein
MLGITVVPHRQCEGLWQTVNFHQVQQHLVLNLCEPVDELRPSPAGESEFSLLQPVYPVRAPHCPPLSGN